MNLEVFMQAHQEAIAHMEKPELIEFEGHTYLADFSPESPQPRSICYDEEARLARKKFPPEASAQGLANAWGLQLVWPALYQAMQAKTNLDTKTSSWLATPEDIRKKGGALFGDHRYGTTFIYHNGADSYYASRGCRFCLLVK